MSQRYAQAGVDVEAGYKAVELMKQSVESTYIPGVLGSLGGFGGLFQPDFGGLDTPVFVSGTDSVGTKVKLAVELDKHDTIGIDCVAMCANDVACSGAQPLFFLDYIGIHKTIPEKVAELVSGVAEGCRQAGCALVGGETAEMPAVYAAGDYDLVGFCVGMVDKPKMVDNDAAQEGDVLLGLPSTGVHSNGFTLIREIFDCSREGLSDFIPSLGKTLGEELLTPTRIYVSAIQALLQGITIKGISHITGGGFYENIPRMLPSGLGVKIDLQAFPRPAIFDLLAERGNLSKEDLYGTFNMGLGLICVISKEEAQAAITALDAVGENAYIVGEVIKNEGVHL
ncbi:MAG: phosphoribosylformylglycinamidine cyclo-ligase [Oscillospiraceae bacterium]|nr:phosphoribosylformylglycinamidine cyclo-ligase [Oscillospiraceae bacterium]